MAADYAPSSACCSTPVIVGTPYKQRGTFFESNDLRIYTSGPEDSTRALFMIYDVFGYSAQILRGADTLAAQGFRIFMPDFFNGKAAPLKWMPMPDEHGKEAQPDDDALTDFCNGPGNTQRTKDRVYSLQKALQEKYPQVTSWGLVGYCWGGYVANYMLDADSPFRAAGELHPAFPEVEIAQKIVRPILALCSKDEPEKEYAHFRPHLQVDAQFVHFPDMLHGWMSARGDLSKPEVEKEFERGYSMLVQWFEKYL